MRRLRILFFLTGDFHVRISEGTKMLKLGERGQKNKPKRPCLGSQI
uniref:Uncharacterized protein n=1 Tax=Meloidogyne enterolobii TaxID=390850 RepID=A0A6V7U2N1_MELEN|nr:unnamed protein product [Meloidogyne enterolobii]